MKPVKRTSSKSPPSRRPAKIRDTYDNCDVSIMESGGYAIDTGREAPASAATANAFFDAYIPRFSSRFDPRSSPAVSSQQHVNRIMSGSQAMESSPTELGRLSHATASAKNMDGVRKAKTPRSSPQELTQHVTGIEPPKFWSETGPDAHTPETNQRVFDLMAEHMLSSGSTAYVDLRGHDTSDQEPPVPAAFEHALSGDFGFDSFYGSLASLDSSACMPNGLSNTAPEQDAMVLARNTDDFSIGTGENFASNLSPASEYRLRIKKSQNALEGIGSHSNTGVPCMVSALRILRALHIPRPACLYANDEIATNSPRQPRMIDSVLSTNRKIILLLSDILKCTCSLNPQVQLVLTVISGKLMAWYRAMIRNDDDSSDDCSSMGQSIVNSNMSDEDQTERVSQRPITVGDYSFDVALEGKIRAQVVSSELQHVDRLVESLSKRIQESNFGKHDIHPGFPTWGETGQAKAIHGALSALLHKQMQAAKSEVSFQSER
ncbi:MAG: hypothetical protein Q9161_000909 [Pseudevernia consocians]